MDARHFAEGIVPACLAAAAIGATAGAPEVTTDSPLGLMRWFEMSYEGRDAAAYGALFTTDFRFHFGDPELRARYPDGWTRADEIAAARHLFEGFRDAAGTYRPPARRLELTLSPFTVAADPERADSAAWYQVVSVPCVRLAVWTEDGNFLVENDRHDFHMVRGDAARLDPGQPADPDRWYIRRWVEIVGGGDPEGVAGALEGDPPAAGGEPAAQPDAEPAPPTRSAIEAALPNPARGTVVFAFTLTGEGPAALEVLDAAGRLRLRRDLGTGAAGRHRVAWDLGRRLPPGVYWVRLVEAGGSDIHRLVLAR